MQRVCSVAGGVNDYLVDPDCLITTSNRECPFCPTRHQLRINGWYKRWVLLPGDHVDHRIRVRRLLCRYTGHTVSLLPDFCLPRRQHGPEILARFLVGVALLGLSLLTALRSARPDAPCHSVAQSLLQGFQSRGALLIRYMTGRGSRLPPVPTSVSPPRRLVAQHFLCLQEGFHDPEAAFIHHARCFHGLFQLGLA